LSKVNNRSGDMNKNRVGAMRFGNRYKADYVEGTGSNMRIGHRNKNKAGNVKATGKEQDSGHFTERSARSLRSLRSRPRYEEKKLKFLGHEKIQWLIR